MNKLLVSLLLSALTLPGWAADTTKFTVNGMVCAFCAQGIEKRLSAMPATKALYVNLGQKIVAVEAKDGQTLDIPKITAEIVDAGYAVTQTETVTQSVADIKAEMKARR